MTVINFIKPSLLLLGIITISGCSTLGYFAHTTNGHLALVTAKEPITEILASKKYTEKQRAQLAEVLRIRTFASEGIGLPSNKSYTEYVHIEREHVTWIVFATDELSLKPTTWCYWALGCVPYRGYFAKNKAEQFAAELYQTGHDVYIAPVPAYSTLGWFTDPLLSTMLRNGEIITAEYIFHELVHQLIYFKNDTEFNEAFASAVARLAVEDWLTAEGEMDQLLRYQEALAKRDKLFSLTKKLRRHLSEIYTGGMTEQLKLQLKQQAFDQHRDSFHLLTKDWPNLDVYRKSALSDMNNAKLNAQSTYNDLIPDFIALFQRCEKEYKRFYSAVARLEKLERTERVTRLRKMACKDMRS